jgi:hypothetical protein
MGCFSGDVFDPGPEGANIIRGWQLADEWSAGPRELLAELVRAAHGHPSQPGQPAVSVPQQARPIQTARSFSAARR